MNGKKNKILIVDDSEDMRGLYAEVFRQENFEVEEAMDGLEGLEKANKSVPDIIFTGIIMPRMDGFAFKEALSKNVNTANIPIVMSSHLGRKEDEVRAKEMGIRDFIVQGIVTPKQALARIKAILESESRPAYMLEFNPEENVRPSIAAELKCDKDFKCSSCGTSLALNLKIQDAGKKEFFGRLVCPKCGR